MKKLSIAIAVLSLSIAAPVFACPHDDGAAPRTADKAKATETKDTAKADSAKEAKPAKAADKAKTADKVSQK
jgi:hypothetical protein